MKNRWKQKWMNKWQKMKNNKNMFFGRKNEQESDQNGRCKKETKKSRLKKGRKEKERNRIKKNTPTTFSKKCDIFQKSKDVKKGGDAGIELKRDVKHNLKVKRLFIKYKIWRKEIHKRIEKTRRHFKNEGFFFFFWWFKKVGKSTKLEMRTVTQDQEKERTKNMFIQMEGKRNKRNMCSKKKIQ